jgi:glycosyltransferase involved in cell wall biosynthesis
MAEHAGEEAAAAAAATAVARPRVLFLGRVVHGYTWRLLGELERNGVEVRAVYRDAPAAMTRQFAHESGPDGDVPALNSDRAPLREAVRFMEADAADAVIALGGSGNLRLLLAAWWRTRPGTPIVLFTDANVPRGPGAPRDWARHVLYRLLRPLVTEAWTLGRSNEEALRCYGVRRHRRLPLYATDFDALGGGGAAPSPREAGAIRLLCVARLSPEKNLAALCEALQDDAVAGRFELTLAGEGPERAALEAAARRSRAPIRLLGAVPRERMGTVFAQADALILPSRWEPWGIAVVEALGLGLPVVATTRVGSAVSLADGGGVVLSRGTDPASLRGALRALADGWDAHRAAARAGSARVRDEFGTRAVAQRIAAVLRGERPISADARPGPTGSPPP